MLATAQDNLIMMAPAESGREGERSKSQGVKIMTLHLQRPHCIGAQMASDRRQRLPLAAACLRLRRIFVWPGERTAN